MHTQKRMPEDVLHQVHDLAATIAAHEHGTILLQAVFDVLAEDVEEIDELARLAIVRRHDSSDSL